MLPPDNSVPGRNGRTIAPGDLAMLGGSEPRMIFSKSTIDAFPDHAHNNRRVEIG
jgi:hypothetical protein